MYFKNIFFYFFAQIFRRFAQIFHLVLPDSGEGAVASSAPGSYAHGCGYLIQSFGSWRQVIR